MRVLVSACLVGLNTRYDGKNTKSNEVLEYIKSNKIEFFPLCAEQLGGLETPREPCEIENGYTSKDILDGKGRVLSKSGKDLTEYFLKGAYLVLEFCKEFNITHAILQDRSPSCGYTKIYDGGFSGNLLDGRGITAELLIQNGVEVVKI